MVLKLDEDNVPHLVVRARSIVQQMTGNPWFPSPSPPLADVRSAIDVLDAAEVRTHTRAPDSVTDRDAKRMVLMQRLDELRAYVFKIACDNPDHVAEIVASAGMYLKQLRGPSPQVFAAEPGSHSGEIDVTAPRAGDRAAYEFQYSLDGGKTWLPFPQAVETKASATLPRQRPGSTVHLRYRATVKGVTGDWSDVISIIVE
ncbi:MAG TPA: hypothetical protein VMI75_20645 [Polyangiaceae bacterium]|nr:hypothetical protein [Polyangiaceae bacterium]